MTKNELLKRHDHVLELSNKLIIALQSLGAAASEFCGVEMQAEICEGEEIEFRRVQGDGMVDSRDCVRLEDVLNRLGQ
ncbi:MAG: hypothetical protein IJ640_00715 [Prevotella sp.]|nr:hypothetical protein [Prevotella sp.]